MASKKVKLEIKNEETLLTNEGVSLKYSDVLSQVLMSAGEGITTIEMDVRFTLTELVNKEEKVIKFNRIEEVQFIATLLSKFNFSVISKDLVDLQKSLNNLIATAQ